MEPVETDPPELPVRGSSKRALELQQEYDDAVSKTEAKRQKLRPENKYSSAWVHIYVI